MKNGQYAKRIETAAAVYLSSVLEYLTAEVLELSGNACMDHQRKRIQDKHIYLAIDKDSELKRLIEENPSFSCVSMNDLDEHRPKKKIKKIKKKKGRWDDHDIFDEKWFGTMRT